MANRHFGEIGDVWKHLLLSEILAIEKPTDYWESHAGSAEYALKHSDEKDYGVFYFLEHADESDALNSSSYNRLLKSLVKTKELKTYPGSPFIAMRLLKDCSFIFCDTDEESLDNIESAARKLKIPPKSIRVVERDGVPALAEFAAKVPLKDVDTVLAFIDPYRLFVKSDNDMNALELFAHLSQRGVKTVLWYGYDSDEYREMIFICVRIPFMNVDSEMLVTPSLWCADINLVAMEDSTFNEPPGVFGCGIICANLSDKAIKTCDKLGYELSAIYESAVLPDERSGALVYRSMPLM